jgi:hypothetical protein
MRNLIVLAAAILTLATSSSASAQFSYHSHYSFGRESVVRHRCDSARLREYVAELGIVCQHLNSDAQQLSNRYANSAIIKSNIQQLEHLKVHMHQLLTRVTNANSYTHSVDVHIKNDTAEVRELLSSFYGAVSGQALVGACARDQALLEHMEVVILHEAFPLLGQLETELYGAPQGELCPSELGLHSATRVHHAGAAIGPGAYAPTAIAPRGHVHVEQRTTYRPVVASPAVSAPAMPVPPGPVPPFVARMMQRAGYPTAAPVATQIHTHTQIHEQPTTVRLGRFRIQF